MSHTHTRPRGLRAAVGVVAAAAMSLGSLVAVSAPASAATGDITLFALPAGSGPSAIAAGPDGNLYTANTTAGTVSKVDTSGSVLATYALGAGTSPLSITAGPDGNLWLGLGGTANAIGKMTTGGALTTYPIPTANAVPYAIAAGPDGALWFTERTGNKIGRVTTAGAITEYALPTANAGPLGITPGPENSNRMYFTESTAGKIGYITMAGQVTETVTLPNGSQPNGIALVNNSVWFAQTGTSSLGHLVNDTTVAQIAVGAPIGGLVASGSDAIWMTAVQSVLRANGQGGVTGTYALPAGGVGPAVSPVMGSDGNVWFVAFGSQQIGRAASGVVPVSKTAPAITPATGLTPGTPVATSNGTWDYASTYAYQWQRCSTSDVATCANIPNATAATYTLTTSEDRQYIRAGVTASNASGASQPSYSASVAVGSLTPAPKPAPGPATGTTASIGNGASMQIIAPNKQKLGKKAVYEVVFTVTDVQGTVTMQFQKGKKGKTVANLPITSGTAKYSFKVKKNWKKGKMSVTATYTAAPTSPYNSAAVKDTVKIK